MSFRQNIPKGRAFGELSTAAQNIRANNTCERRNGGVPVDENGPRWRQPAAVTTLTNEEDNVDDVEFLWPPRPPRRRQRATVPLDEEEDGDEYHGRQRVTSPNFRPYGLPPPTRPDFNLSSPFSSSGENFEIHEDPREPWEEEYQEFIQSLQADYIGQGEPSARGEFQFTTEGYFAEIDLLLGAPPQLQLTHRLFCAIRVERFYDIVNPDFRDGPIRPAVVDGLLEAVRGIYSISDHTVPLDRDMPEADFASWRAQRLLCADLEWLAGNRRVAKVLYRAAHTEWGRRYGQQNTDWILNDFASVLALRSFIFLAQERNGRLHRVHGLVDSFRWARLMPSARLVEDLLGNL